MVFRWVPLAVTLGFGTLGVACSDEARMAEGEQVGARVQGLEGWNVTIASNQVPQLIIYTGLGVGACASGTSCSSQSATYAHELRRYLDRITGGTFSVQTSDGSAAGSGIFVGRADEFPGLQALVEPKLPGPSVPYNFDATWREGYVTQSFSLSSNAPKQVHLIGKTDLGVPHAVSRFLEEVGCRWLMPGPKWEVVPSTPTLVFGKAIADRPVFALRQIAPQWSGMNTADAKAWAWHNRMTSFDGSGSSLAVSAGQGAWTGAIRYNQAWFDDPQAPDVRYGQLDYAAGHFNPGYASCTSDSDCVDRHQQRDPSMFCGCMDTACTLAKKKCTARTPEIGSQAVADKFTEYVIDRLQETGRDGESVEPSDGQAYASDTPQARVGNGSFSDQVGWLANRVAIGLRNAPDPAMHQKMVAFIGYAEKATPPSFPLESNVWVDVLFSPTQEYATWGDALTAWGQAVPGRVGVRDNLSYYQSARDVWPGGWSSYGPGEMNDSVYLQSFLKTARDNGVRAVKLETSFSWGLAGLGYYLFAKLAWNPNADVAALRTEIMQRTFGAGYGVTRTFFVGLDPQGKPLIATKNQLKGLFGALDLASQYTAGDAAVQPRLLELKSWLHYQTLFWKLYRTTSTAEQADLARQICNLGYRLRDSFMLTYQGPTYLFAIDAARQFGVTQADGSPDPTWVGASPDVIWKTPADPPSASEVESWFQADRAFFDIGGNPGQATYSNDLVPVLVPHTLPAGSAEPAPVFYTVRAPLRLATYSFDGTLAVCVQPRYPTRPDVAVTIRDKDENVVLNVKINASGPGGTPATAQTLPTGDALAANTMYFLDVEPLTNGVWISANAGVPLAAVADKVYRPVQGGIDAAVYVPKASAGFSYVWTTQYDQFFSSSGSAAAFPQRAAIPPHAHQLWDANNAPVSYAGSTDIRSPNEAIMVSVPLAQRGKIWTLKNIRASQLWFYSVPPYYGPPASLMVPRSVAEADCLRIRTGVGLADPGTPSCP